MASFGPGSAGRGGFARSDGDDPLFSFFFGEGDPRTTHSRDLEAQVQLTFDQALRGGRTEVQLAGGETVRVMIPTGVRSGVKVRVKNCGRIGRDGTRGDLYVTFRIEPSTRFRREGDNLHVTETISALEAILGTTRSITNAYGQTIKVQIAPGTQPGERLRLRGQGVALKDRTGDLLVEIQVTVPRALTDEQRAELAAAAERVGLL
jgi:DnaJ-class molecular chaperone